MSLVQLCTELIKQTWIWRAAKPNIIELSYVLSLNWHGSDKFSVPTFLVSATRLVQVNMSLASFQTQYSWIQVLDEPKWTWVQWAVRPNTLGFSYLLSLWRVDRPHTLKFSYLQSPNGYRSSELLDPLLVDLASCQAKVGLGMAIIVGPMLGSNILFVYFYDF
jgi:hypothetical protein